MLVEPNEKSRVLATLVLVGISGDLVVPKVNPELVALEVGFSLAFPVSLEVERELSESFGASLVPKEKFREVCGCKIVEVVVVTAFDAVVTATAGGFEPSIPDDEVGASLVDVFGAVDAPNKMEIDGAVSVVATALLEAASVVPKEKINGFELPAINMSPFIAWLVI